MNSTKKTHKNLNHGEGRSQGGGFDKFYDESVTYEQLITDSISAMWGNACETVYLILFRNPLPSHAEFSCALPA